MKRICVVCGSSPAPAPSTPMRRGRWGARWLALMRAFAPPSTEKWITPGER